MNAEIDSEVLARHQAEVKRYFWRNYLAHGIEGALFMGGLAFVAPLILLPVMVSELGGSSWMIAMAPTMLLIGFQLPGVFVAHRIERMSAMRPFIIKTGIAQRLPYLVAGLLLYFWSGMPVAAALLTVMLAPFVAGFIGGINVTAWLEFVAKTIPENRRSSLWAFRFILTAFIAVGAGKAVELILEFRPGIPGYGLLHLIVSIFLLASFAVFLCTRETTQLPPKKQGEPETWHHLLRSIPAMVTQDPIYGRYLLSRFFYAGIFLVLPFMSLHALHRLDLPASFTGVLVMWQAFGGIAGNFLGGLSGDRLGAKIPLALGCASLAASAAWAMTASSPLEFKWIFWVVGAGMGLVNVATPSFNLELAPVQKRISYLAVFGITNMLALLLASIAAGIYRDAGGSFTHLAQAAVGLLFSYLLLLASVPNPRKKSA